ncbi:MAG: hypothetical protein A2Y12_19115 [Planctomycetes bacterium GWF2_42_9]|nr:MAG: hypothetical protein A2Y12_19115 [Planctomycetes bacterium GWF2_42_9]
MNYIPALEKSTEKQIMSFKRTLLIDADSLAVSLNGNEDAKELHAKRSELKKLARSIIDTTTKEKRNLSEAENDAFDVCTNLLNDIQCAFDMRSEKTFATNGINEVSNETTGETSTRSIETWTDQQTGKPVPILGKEHRFADHIQRNGNEISSRDYFAGLAGHRVSAEARAQSIGTDTKGGFMVPEHISAEVIDLLRAKNVCIQAGARTMPMSAQTVRVCRVDSDPVASWTGESSLIPDTDMNIGALDFIAHKLTCLIKVSRELLQDAGNASTVIQNAIATAMSAELDSAALSGSGAGCPLGIANHTTINTYSLGVDGHILNGYDDILYGIKEIISVNGPIPKTAIMSPRTLIGYSLEKSGDGKPLERPDLVKSMTFIDSSKMPVTEVQGASGAVCSSIILGGFESLVIGIRSIMDIQVLNERFADTGQVGFLATMRADTAVYQPKAFCKIIGIKP